MQPPKGRRKKGGGRSPQHEDGAAAEYPGLPPGFNPGRFLSSLPAEERAALMSSIQNMFMSGAAPTLAPFERHGFMPWLGDEDEDEDEDEEDEEEDEGDGEEEADDDDDMPALVPASTIKTTAPASRSVAAAKAGGVGAASGSTQGSSASGAGKGKDKDKKGKDTGKGGQLGFHEPPLAAPSSC